MYAEGHGVPQDLAQAITWFRKAQAREMPWRSTTWARCMPKALGAPQDFAQAFSWFGKSADQGNAVAQATLGWWYADGQTKVVPQDFAQAFSWLPKAADQGNAFAQANFGVLYAGGQGVPQDYTQALMWSTLAMTRAQDDVTRDLAAKVRDAIEFRISPAPS